MAQASPTTLYAAVQGYVNPAGPFSRENIQGYTAKDSVTGVLTAYWQYRRPDGTGFNLGKLDQNHDGALIVPGYSVQYLDLVYQGEPAVARLELVPATSTSLAFYSLEITVGDVVKLAISGEPGAYSTIRCPG